MLSQVCGACRQMTETGGGGEEMSRSVRPRMTKLGKYDRVLGGTSFDVQCKRKYIVSMRWHKKAHEDATVVFMNYWRAFKSEIGRLDHHSHRHRHLYGTRSKSRGLPFSPPLHLTGDACTGLYPCISVVIVGSSLLLR